MATLLSGAVAEADTFTVTNTNATGSGSLAGEITAANGDTTPSSNTIVFQSGLSGAIDLTAGLPSITHPVTITGPGANVLTVHGTGSNGIFYIGSGLSPSTEISGLGMTGGDNKYGGAVSANSPVILSGDDIFTNTGAIGGGVAGPTVDVLGSTISGNTAVVGGGVASDKASGGIDAKYSTIEGNTASTDAGGGLAVEYGSLITVGDTISGNAAPGTGTTAGNGAGGGIYLSKNVTSSDIYDTIVFGNTAGNSGPDVYLASGGTAPIAKFSLFGTLSHSGITADSSDIVGPNPLLGPLQNNGGTTPTMAPAFNSPVIDQGKAFGTSQDQRGDARPTDLPGYPNASGGDGSDIGAVELQASEVAPSVSGLSVASGPAGTSVVISGSRLATASSVMFGSTSASFTVNSSGQVVATAPAGSGTVDVRVTTPGGETAAVAADQFTYKVSTPPPPPPPTPTTQTTTATDGNQKITLTSPSLSACVASTSPLKATLNSSMLSTGTKLRFSSAGFFIDKGVKHTKKKTEHLKNGTTKKITVTTYVANAVAHSVPVTVEISLSGVKSGSHTLKVVISYKETVTKHHKKKTETVTKTVSSSFTVC